MKISIVAIVCLLVGYFLYPVINPVQNLSVEKKEKFEKFLNTEARTFAELQDADAKLKAAEAMYGKMVMLFLAELGLRTQHEIKPTIVKEPEIKPSIGSGTQEVSASSETSSAPVVGPEKKQDNKKLLSKEKAAWGKYTTTPFLETLEGKAKRLIGRFEGTLNHEVRPHTGRVDSIVMQFNLVQKDKQIEGDTYVSMTDPEGKEYSRNAGNGGNHAIKGITDQAEAYYVEASPTSYFMINLSSYPQVTGQYYEKGTFVGTVQLRKTDH